MTDLDYLDDLDAEEASSIRPAVGNWVNVTIAFVLALVVAVMNTGPNTTSDSGAYLSVEALVLRGHRLYSGVFDNKDPLFYYVNAGFLWVVGPRGPAIAEALVLALAGAGAAWFALRRGVGWALAVVISATIPIALTCGPAIPGLTHSWGMAFLLLAILALLEHRVGLAGSLVAVAALLELRTAVIGVGAVIAYLVVTRSGRRAWARPAAGAAIVAGVALVALAVRGEFVGYLQVQLYNLRHVEMVRELHHTAGSFPTVLRSGFRTVQGVAPAELLLVVTVAATAIVAIAGRRRVVLALRQRDDGGPGTVAGAVPAEVDAWVVLMVAAVTVVVTALTTLFPHHAQLLGLPIALGAVVAVVSFGRFEAAWAPPLVLGAMLLVAVGLGGPWRSQDRLDGWRATLASPSAVALETAVPAGHEVYAIAGEVAYENAHAVFLDDRFRFSCRYIYQHPWDERDFDEFVRCLATQPDVVLRTPYNPGLEAAFPTYRTLHEQVDRVLDECFELEATFDDDVRRRRPGGLRPPTWLSRRPTAPQRLRRGGVVTIGVAGAGFSGAVVARQLAEAGLTVEVFDPRPHVGGNAHTQRSPSGVMVHMYGPHIFHTAWPEVWEYVQRFGVMMPYRHRVMARVGDAVYALPINLHTINQFFGRSMSPSEAAAFVAARCVGSPEGAHTLEEHGLASVGPEIYQAFFAGYTEKQWGVAPARLPATVLKRLPLRFDYNAEYFDHPYQGIPRDGYAAMVEQMLDHEGITVRLGTGLDPDDVAEFEHCFWSGPLDEFFGGSLGTLSYRTLDFEVEEHVGDVQGCPVMNYCDVDVPFTRTTEFKHFAPWERHDASVVYREFSRLCGPGDAPYYPLRLVDDVALLDGYVAAAQAARTVTFIGRLGTYRYLDMDVTIREALTVAARFLGARSTGDPLPVFSVDPT